MSLPLKFAMLCIDCDTISRGQNNQCELCGQPCAAVAGLCAGSSGTTRTISRQQAVHNGTGENRLNASSPTSRRGSGATVAIGGLDRLITIEQRTGTNAYNHAGRILKSAFAANIWAKIEHVGGKEVVNQTEYVADITDRFTVPYVAGVSPKMRMNHVDIDGKTRYFDILFVQNVEQRGFFHVLLAKEIYSNT